MWSQRSCSSLGGLLMSERNVPSGCGVKSRFRELACVCVGLVLRHSSSSPHQFPAVLLPVLPASSAMFLGASFAAPIEAIQKLSIKCFIKQVQCPSLPSLCAIQVYTHFFFKKSEIGLLAYWPLVFFSLHSLLFFSFSVEFLFSASFWNYIPALGQPDRTSHCPINQCTPSISCKISHFLVK